MNIDVKAISSQDFEHKVKEITEEIFVGLKKQASQETPGNR